MVKMKNQAGLSAIELLIAMLVISIILVVAVPNILGSRHSANAGSAIASLRALHEAQTTYSKTLGKGNYAGLPISTTKALEDLTSVGLIDQELGKGTKNGYSFVGGQNLSSALSPSTFWFSAVPSVNSGISKTGRLRFGITNQGIVKGDDNLSSHYKNDAEVMAATDIIN
jgi:prepilin-type N-terminal cleavage/methylation domain-containing protein